MCSWFRSVYLVCRREFRLVFTDAGVILFFFLLPTVYPIVYTLIYNPEVVRELTVAWLLSTSDAAEDTQGVGTGCRLCVVTEY